MHAQFSPFFLFTPSLLTPYYFSPYPFTTSLFPLYYSSSSPYYFSPYYLLLPSLLLKS